MTKWRNLTIFILLALLVIPVSAAGNSNGVDDLRGRWDIQWQMESEGNLPLPELEVLVTDIEPSQTEADVYLATGCMAIAEEGYYAPLSLQATDNLDGSYDVVFLSTVVPGVNEMGPFIVRFEGYLEVFGSEVTDDVIGGGLETGYGGGGWSGEHHDRRRVKCPAADPSVLYFDPDVYMERERSPNPSPDYTLFGGSTNMVASAMQVEIPDGRVVVVGFEQDIFSAHIDFISEFAFGLNLEETPIVGQPYTITLLDNLGNPIPGTETEDYWFSCPQGAPSNPSGSQLADNRVEVSWTGVADVLGQFEPNGDPQIGFYQLEVGPFESGEMIYGMNWGSSTTHNIPWNPFVVDQIEDDPDGFDHGISLSELVDGLYEYRILSFSESHRDNPGFGHECQSVMNSQNLIMEKSGNDLNFLQLGLISGHVTSSSGPPIADITVIACEYDNEEDPYCQEGYTDGSGDYFIPRLFENDYRVWIQGQPGWVNEFYNDTPSHEDAARVGVLEGQDTSNIDFILEQGGSISGTVFDDQQNPLGGIAVDTENGGFGTCTDENGFYMLEGIPLGDVGVVAGRDFCGEHPYVEQLIAAVPVGSSGVDFYLSEGLYISGTVFDEQGNPLGGIAVDTEEGGFGTCTDENGFYILGALSAGNYNVVAGREFCDPHPYVEQLIAGVEVGSSGVDFYLSEGLYISGTVFDQQGNPLGGIAVDTEEGGFGTCTDENGFYILGALLAGNYNVVAGRDFCDEHPYAVQLLAAIPAGSEGVDFYLEIFVEPSPQFLNVQPDHGWAHSHGWDEGSAVTLSFDGYSSTQTADADGMVYFNDLSGTGIGTGTWVNVTDATDSKDLLVVAASFVGVDEGENTAWGTAPTGSNIGVALTDGEGEEHFFWAGPVLTTSDTWFVDFDDYPVEGGDFGVVTDAWVHVFDEDGDSTIAHYEIP